MAAHLVFGLDIGGTSTHGIRAEHNGQGWQVTREAWAGSANLQNVSAVEAQSALHDVARQLGFDRLPRGAALRVVAGSGGVDTPEDIHRLQSMITAAIRPPTTDSEPLSAHEYNMTVVHDTRLILAAGGTDAGVAVIAGTGSVAWGRTPEGREARRGGWGHLLGDEGSSWWIGREAVRRTLRRHDTGMTVDDLDQAILQARNLTTRDQLIADFHAHPSRTEWSDVARLVDQCADQGHIEAGDLLSRAAEHLVTAARDVSAHLNIQGPVVAGGGLVQRSRHLQREFERCSEAAGLTPVKILQVDPVMGALHLAERGGQP